MDINSAITALTLTLIFSQISVAVHYFLHGTRVLFRVRLLAVLTSVGLATGVDFLLCHFEIHPSWVGLNTAMNKCFTWIDGWLSLFRQDSIEVMSVISSIVMLTVSWFFIYPTIHILTELFIKEAFWGGVGIPKSVKDGPFWLNQLHAVISITASIALGLTAVTLFISIL